MDRKLLSFNYETRYVKPITTAMCIIMAVSATSAMVWSCVARFRVNTLLLILIILPFVACSIYYQCRSVEVRYDDRYLYIERRRSAHTVPISSLRSARRKMYYFYVLSFDGHPNVVYRVPRFPSDKTHKELEEVLRLAGLWHDAK